MIFAWTDDAIARLREIWHSDMTTPEIGADLGCSKNAAIGKAARLGLGPKKRVQQFRSARTSRRNRRDQAADHSQRERLKAAATRKTAAPRIRVVARVGRLVEPLNLPFSDLDDNNKPTMCRFPTIEREGKQMFCARPVAHGASWCDDCARVALTAAGYEQLINRRPKGGHMADPYSAEKSQDVSHAQTLCAFLAQQEARAERGRFPLFGREVRPA
jgi:hypothetical protein